ncbi:MAG TPA: hypothetical protein VN428_24405 [Bryobacteraceae bacterium]|nr:hypothetical protein [Bryobacteraceae bacterium]
MRILVVMSLCCLGAAAQEGGFQLEDVARAATVMVDGDLAKRIQTPRSVSSMLVEDPRDRWAASDKYEVDHAAFLTMKKTLTRLTRLCSATCDVNLWMPVPKKPGNIQVLIRTLNETSQFWPWGALTQETPPEMAGVLKTGQRVTVSRRPGIVSVLAPVHDSLGDIAGLVEVVSRVQPDPQENVQ